MSAGHTYTDWHLTPRGWERGSTRKEGGGGEIRVRPVDAALSCCYSSLDKCCEVEWRSSLSQVKALEAKFGPCPKRT